jgi:hypothetical protein
MKPTPKLRFVKRVIAVPATDGVGRTVRVLQQWWEKPDSFDMITGLPVGEWRDVPLEQE